mgnify:CR=1 FL=1
MKQVEANRYAASIRGYAEQWTDAQIEEAIADERRILQSQSLSDVARDNSDMILNIYLDVLNQRQENSAA